MWIGEWADTWCRFHLYLMMSSAFISFSQASISSLASMWTLHFPCCTHCTLGLSMVLYSPGMLPLLWKESGNIYLRSSVLLMIIWSYNGGMEVEWYYKGCTDELWFCNGWNVTLWSCKAGNAAVVDMFSGCCACFPMTCRCLYCVPLLWHSTLHSPRWVLATWDIIISFWYPLWKF